MVASSTALCLVLGVMVVAVFSNHDVDTEDPQELTAQLKLMNTEMEAMRTSVAANEKKEKKHALELAVLKAKAAKHAEERAASEKRLAAVEHKERMQKANEKTHLAKISAAEEKLEGCVSLKEGSDIKEIREREATEEQRVERLTTKVSAQRQDKGEVQSLSAVGSTPPSIPPNPRAIPRTRRTTLRLGGSAMLHSGAGGPYDGGCPYNISEPDAKSNCANSYEKEACLDAGHEKYDDAMMQCRQMCTIARHPVWNNTLWCDPAVHAVHMKGPVYMPSGTLPIGHQNCQDKYRAEMNNYDDTPLSNEGHEHNNWGGVAPGDLLNRRQLTSSPVALCGKCADRSFMLQASMVVGMQMVLGVCIPISSHPLFVQMHSTCGDGSGSNPDDMTQCTTASMPMRCEEFVSGFGAVERVNTNTGNMDIDHTHAYTDDAAQFSSRPKVMDGVAFTCAGVQIRDAYDTSSRDKTDGLYKVRVYRAAIGYMVECHGSKEASPKQIADGNLAEPSLECTRREETKGCRTRIIDLSDEEGNTITDNTARNAVRDAIKDREDSVTSQAEADRWLDMNNARNTAAALDAGTTTTADEGWEECDFLSKSRMVAKS